VAYLKLFIKPPGGKQKRSIHRRM